MLNKLLTRTREEGLSLMYTHVHTLVHKASNALFAPKFTNPEHARLSANKSKVSPNCHTLFVRSVRGLKMQSLKVIRHTRKNESPRWQSAVSLVFLEVHLGTSVCAEGLRW